MSRKKTVKSKKALSPYLKGDKKNVLVIGDTHLPFCKHGYLEFCREMQEKHNCGTVVHIGDEVDLCAISQYESDPDGMGAESEAAYAQEALLLWYKVFPTVSVCIGNHSARVFRAAHSSGIPKRFIKSYEETWNAPKGWKWDTSFTINGVYYTHLTGMSGPSAAIKKAMQLRMPVVGGHIHTEATIQFSVSAIDAIFGLQVGCGIDDKQYAFAYAKENLKKSIISCGIVKDRTPIIELMKL